MAPPVFEQAEVYIKDLFAVPIEKAILEMNQQLENDRVIPGLKLVVTGGQAIQTFFPNSQELRTHDFDLKLVAPKTTQITDRVKNRMRLLGKGIAKYLEIELNEYATPILPTIRRTLKQKYGLALIGDQMFTAKTNLKREQLNILVFTLSDGNINRTNSIADVFVVDPDEINHWKTFTGLEGSDEILSQQSGKYYIPLTYINNIPYANMGYILWDTLRMVQVSFEDGLEKHPRYVAKRDAIIYALNNPTNKISCNALKRYIVNCEKTYYDCEIKGKRYKTIEALIRYGINEGILPSDPEVISFIKSNYDLNYVCNTIKRLS